MRIDDLKDLHWYTETSQLFMSRGYFNKGKDINSAIRDMANHSANLLGKGTEYRDKLESYLRKGLYVVPTPTWKNMNDYSTESPISCFGVYVDDTVESIVIKSAEVALQNKIGGGTSGVFSFVRERGATIGDDLGKSNGTISMMQIYQTMAAIISQPNRRGHFSATLSIDHPDFDEFIGANRDEHPLQSISTGVTISDDFMERLIRKDSIAVGKMQKLAKAKYETGYPYIFFEDTVNRNKPEIYTLKNFIIHHSNMCQEICLPNNPDETFVCCLLGMNLELFDYWKDSDAVEIGIYFMDSMLMDFERKMEIKRLENEDYYNVLYKPSVTFVKNHRALGMGASGLHGYLKSKMIPFYSLEGRSNSTYMQKVIQEQSKEASRKMALEYGRALIFEGTDIWLRHTTTTAIAPNTSSSFVLDMQPQSIEPSTSNYYIKDVVNVKIEVRDKYLKPVLAKYGKDVEDVWMSILRNSGSVQHLDFLSQDEKDVFLTFFEIPQDFILEMAASRQKYIDQSQSLNLMIGNGVPPEEVIYLIMKAWALGVKTLYYQLNVSQAQEFTKSRECVSCAG